ncbi:hypothetical protein HDA40_004542 [Hamadaea flava]|uniref:Uncharacterized protein n=1 Tax=Hamadaea flava TaxID=1742688 RepID=A0ABV8LEH7_9ACTN|nr:hypothetical protein [Hamadaea flava]MCP2326035.1 hypothetical protein [Hamadaea flava]
MKMSVCRALAGVSLGALLGVPLAAQPAFAEPEAGTQVEFDGGGLGLLLCGSKPDRPAVTIKSEQKVVFVNNLGQGATLQIDGENGGPISDGQAVEVQFHKGPVAIAMVPDCLLNLGGNGSYEPVTVNVNASSPSSGGNSTGAPRVVKTRTPKPKPSGTTVPSAGASSSEEAPLFPLEPDPSGSVAAAGDSLEPGSTVVTPSGESVIGMTDLANDTPRDKGPIGLLAIIATVCVVGVTVGAIRAIVSQRATRTEFA